MDKYTASNKIIIISESISKYVKSSKIDGCKVIITNEVITTINNILAEQYPPPVFMILLISSIEYSKLPKAFLKSHSQQISIQVILQVDSEKNNIESLTNDDMIGSVFDGILGNKEYIFSVHNLFRKLDSEYQFRTKNYKYHSLLFDMKQDQEDLINIGRSLTQIKDTSKLLREILYLSKKITEADAGSIYLIEEQNDERVITFKFSHTYSKEVPLEEFSLPYDISSIAGFVAITGKVLNIPDVYKLEDGSPLSFNNSFDQAHNYRSKSMLVVPMRNHIDEIIGVIQLINSKVDYNQINNNNIAFSVKLRNKDDFDKKVHPFDHRYEGLMEAVAGQAAIAIENNRMYEQIQYQFEEFVKASVTAIESRDPATSGHSFRVADICLVIANEVSKSNDDPFKKVTFTETQMKELEYAALLHDFGKVYIDLAIFMKAKKLFPKELDNLLLKLDFLYRSAELQYITNEKYVALSNRQFVNDKDKNKNIDNLEKTKKEILLNIKNIKQTLTEINEPSVLDSDSLKKLDTIIKNINKIDCLDIDGKLLEIINKHEKENLSIKKGSLNKQERKEIESHVLHTYNFVSKIPWPDEYKNIPNITRWHHELLDGSGYPDGLVGDQIPLQSRIMTIADIYDALTAKDRPYKKAIPHSKAIKILKKEASSNKLDKDLVNLFIKSNYIITD